LPLLGAKKVQQQKHDSAQCGDPSGSSGAGAPPLPTLACAGRSKFLIPSRALWEKKPCPGQLGPDQSKLLPDEVIQKVVALTELTLL